MFVESLVESTPLLRNRNRMPALVSVATVQCALVALLIAIPILHPEVLHPAAILGCHDACTATDTSAQATAYATPAGDDRRSRPPRPSAPFAPTRPISAQLNRAFKSDAPGVDAPALAFGSPMGNRESRVDSKQLCVHQRLSSNQPQAQHASSQISQGVIAGLLLAPIHPIYPPIARATGTQGTVVIEAIISKSGRIESAHTVSGPIMLQAAALRRCTQRPLSPVPAKRRTHRGRDDDQYPLQDELNSNE